MDSAWKTSKAMIRKLEKEKVIGGVKAKALSKSVWVDSHSAMGKCLTLKNCNTLSKLEPLAML